MKTSIKSKICHVLIFFYTLNANAFNHSLSLHSPKSCFSLIISSLTCDHLLACLMRLTYYVTPTNHAKICYFLRMYCYSCHSCCFLFTVLTPTVINCTPSKVIPLIRKSECRHSRPLTQSFSCITSLFNGDILKSQFNEQQHTALVTLELFPNT